MRTLILMLFLSLNCLSIFAQCDCDKIDQKNGTFYNLCKPILTAIDTNIGQISLGISGLGESRYIYINIAFKNNPQIINGGLTITTSDKKGWICVLVQRDLKLKEGVQTAYGLFVTSNEELLLMDKSKVLSISYYLADGQKRTVPVTYLTNNLPNQINCLKE